MKHFLILVFLLGTIVQANEIKYWGGSGTAVRSQNGKVWESLACNSSLGMYAGLTQTTNTNSLVIMGSLCYRLDIGVTLKNESGNLILMKNSYGFSAPWTSQDIGKVVGKINGESFYFSFTIVNNDRVSSLVQGKMEVHADKKSAKILFSSETQMTNGQKYKTEVSGVVVR